MRSLNAKSPSTTPCSHILRDSRIAPSLLAIWKAAQGQSALIRLNNPCLTCYRIEIYLFQIGVRFMATGIRWQVCEGGALLNALESKESLAPYINGGGGLYFWKLSYRAEQWESSDSSSMLNWLDNLMSTVRGRSKAMALSHILQIPPVEIRGQKLNADKRQYLSQFLKSPKSRRWLAQYIESLEQFAPTLYVGETADLRRRAAEHVRHQTDFGIAVQESGELSWSHLDFHYLPLQDFESRPEKLRKSLEYVAAALTVAGLTKRPG